MLVRMVSIAFFIFPCHVRHVGTANTASVMGVEPGRGELLQKEPCMSARKRLISV